MNESLDKLLLRIIMAFSLCMMILIYKYAHFLFHPGLRNKLLKKFYPSQNPSDTIHFFSRVIGIGIVLTAPFFDLEYGIVFAFTGYILQALIALGLYTLSIYIIEGMTLYNYEYNDEVLTRKNLCYSTVCFSEAIAIAFILKYMIVYSNFSIFTLLYFWLLSLVMLGLSIKLYHFRSSLDFSKLMIHKNISLALSFSGHVFGSSVIIIASFNHNVGQMEEFTFQVLLKIVLALIILPIIQNGILFIFKITDDQKGLQSLDLSSEDAHPLEESEKDGVDPSFGSGLTEGTLFLTSSLLTSTIIGPVNFGNFYPLFH
ncbi:MAG: hypothetical protein HQK50_03230 [Oligoflexia bacterium]|nr:hypothetical protein [Oligoflexia bacterium]MBF0364555.1 hypothetical protein [Oligoflexia bacterium]